MNASLGSPETWDIAGNLSSMKSLLAIALFLVLPISAPFVLGYGVESLKYSVPVTLVAFAAGFFPLRLLRTSNEALTAFENGLDNMIDRLGQFTNRIDQRLAENRARCGLMEEDVSGYLQKVFLSIFVLMLASVAAIAEVVMLKDLWSGQSLSSYGGSSLDRLTETMSANAEWMYALGMLSISVAKPVFEAWCTLGTQNLPASIWTTSTTIARHMMTASIVGVVVVLFLVGAHLYHSAKIAEEYAATAPVEIFDESALFDDAMLLDVPDDDLAGDVAALEPIPQSHLFVWATNVLRITFFLAVGALFTSLGWLVSQLGTVALVIASLPAVLISLVMNVTNGLLRTVRTAFLGLVFSVCSFMVFISAPFIRLLDVDMADDPEDFKSEFVARNTEKDADDDYADDDYADEPSDDTETPAGTGQSQNWSPL